MSRFFDLFAGRQTKVGLSEPKIKGKERSENTTPTNLGHLMNSHLTDAASDGVGCYPVNEEGMALWGCFDFDSKTSEPARDAAYAAATLERAGLHGIVEMSRSGEGRHVWVFLDERVNAHTLRKALLLVDEAGGLECSEINPKQRPGADFSKTVGNYVRLPYHARWVDEGRMICFDNRGEPLTLEGFLDYAEAHKSSSRRVLELAQRYHPKPPPKRHVPVSSHSPRSSIAAPAQDAQLIMRGDPIFHEGGFHDGRNNKLWCFANYLARHPGYANDIEAAYTHMQRVWEEQLVQEPDFIPADVCQDMIRRAFEGAQQNAEVIYPGR